MDGENYHDNFQQRINNLESELKISGNNIMNHISSLYSDNESSVINLKNDPRNAIKLLQHDVLDCLQSTQERAEIRKEFADDVENCSNLIDIISKVSSISMKITQCQEAISSTNLIFACNLIIEIKNLLSELPASNTEIGTGEVCTILRKETRYLQSRLLARIKRLLGNCIVCELGKLNITKKLKGVIHGCGEDVLLESCIDLSDIWEALLSIGDVEESIGSVIDSIWQVSYSDVAVI